MLTRAFTFLRSLFISIPLIIIFTFVFGVAVLVLSLIPGGRNRFDDRAMRLWARTVLRASFLRVRVIGLENITPEQSYIFCVNHPSYLDPPLIAAYLPNHLRFLAKRSLFRIPIFGWAMGRMGQLSLDRDNAREASRNLGDAARGFSAGNSIVIFPEGGRSDDGTLRPFKSGGFRLALRLGAPIVPLAIQGTRDALMPGSLNIRGGQVLMQVGRPISTRGVPPRGHEALAQQVRTAMDTMLQKPN